MKFGQALDELEKGNAVARAGWNGKNQYVYMSQIHERLEPCFILKNAQDKFQPGWVLSMGDMRADDWEVFIPL